MTHIEEQTLASLVTGNHRLVPVLEKYHLDFCCKGKRTLAMACNEAGIILQEVLTDIHAVDNTASGEKVFGEMDAAQLVSHILLKHHFYVKQSMPAIQDHLMKVATKHGERFPFMYEVLHLFIQLRNEMSMHLHKEEMVLFPRIKEVQALYHFRQGKAIETNFITGPTGVMEAEHDDAGAAMERIRQLTNNYSIPEGACTTFKVVLAELAAFEADLHQHVHLENNILFPLAEKMVREIILSVN